MFRSCVLLILLVVPFLPVEGFSYIRYRWTGSPHPCQPVNASSSNVVLCNENQTILGYQTYCLCNHTTNEIMLIAYTFELNATGDVTNYTQWVSERYFLGGCNYNALGIPGYTMVLASEPNVCGPMIGDVIAHGAPFDAASWAAYTAHTASPVWANKDAAHSLLPLVTLVASVLNFC